MEYNSKIYLVLAVAKTLIHIGMPRTGSTFLQRSVFPQVPGYQYVDLEFSHYSEIFQKLQYQDDSLYCPQIAADWAAQYAGKNLILSNENFVGQTLHLAATNRSRNAQRLKQLFPEAEILIVLRNQVDLLQSLYAISVYGNVNLTPERFIHFGESLATTNNKYTAVYRTYEPVEHVELYLYTPLINLYQQLFSKVHVMVYEKFASNQQEFLAELGQVVQADVSEINRPAANVSPGSRQLKGMRQLNKFAPLLSSQLGRKVFRKAKYHLEHSVAPGQKFSFSEVLQQRLRAYFAEDNGKLFQNFPQVFEEKFRSHYF